MVTMISNNETVSRQNLWAGNIATSMTSEGKSALLPANVDRSHTEKVFFVGYISNHLKTGHEVNCSLRFPSGTVIKCWVYHQYAVNLLRLSPMWLNINCALLDGNASVLRNLRIFSAAPIIWYLSQERGNLDRKQATIPVKIYSNAHVRLGNFNLPTFCLVYSIVARAWIHKCPSGRPRHVYNSIWAN